jgi:hypothetical protein
MMIQATHVLSGSDAWAMMLRLARAHPGIGETPRDPGTRLFASSIEACIGKFGLTWWRGGYRTHKHPRHDKGGVMP